MTTKIQKNLRDEKTTSTSPKSFKSAHDEMRYTPLVPCLHLTPQIFTKTMAIRKMVSQTAVLSLSLPVQKPITVTSPLESQRPASYLCTNTNRKFVRDPNRRGKPICPSQCERSRRINEFACPLDKSRRYRVHDSKLANAHIGCPTQRTGQPISEKHRSRTATVEGCSRSKP